MLHTQPIMAVMSKLHQRAVFLTALASVVAGAPQGINFALLDTASSVASGPVSDGAPVQSAALATVFDVVPVAAPTALIQARGLEKRDQTIGATSRVSTFDSMFGYINQLTTVKAGVTYWISGGSIHNFYGNIKNYGNIVVSQTDYLKQNPYAGGQTSDWVGHNNANGNLQNAQGALIMLNDIDSKSAPTYDWYINSMTNNGTIQWCGRGDTGGSTYQMYCDNDAINNGLISYEQAFDNYGAAFVWRNPLLTPGTIVGHNLYNNGAFRLINVVYHNVQNVYGTGCWQIGEGGVLYLEDGTGVFQNPTKGPSFPNQSIVFQHQSAVLHMDTAVYSINSSFGPTLYGFGGGNAIEFYEIIQTFAYNPSTGILKVNMVGGNAVSIKLGLGYDPSSFVNKRNPQKYSILGYNAIFYLGTAPSSQTPAVCSISAPICTALSSDSFPSSTSSVISSALSTAPSAVYSTTTLTSGTLATTVTGTPASSGGQTPVTVYTPSASSSFTTSTRMPSSVITSTQISPTATSSTSLDTSGNGSSAQTSAGTATDSAGSPCPTAPEEGTYCGFVNPEDPCAPQPEGFGPVPTPDTPSAFLALPTLHAMASAAPAQVPSTNGKTYQQTFKDLNAASSAQSYLGLHTLQSYDVAECAALCDAVSLCTAFNIYIERDPSQNPTANDSTAATGWGYW
jgi:hypothetical protein